MKKIRVLIVDDSPTILTLLRSLFSNEPDMEVIATGNNGQQAVELTKKLHPDVITMDMKMPIMNGADATRIIMQENPTPIILVTSSFSRKETQCTFEALAAGAIQVMAKPNTMSSKETFAEQCQRLIIATRLMSDVKVIRRNFRHHDDKQIQLQTKFKHANHHYEIITIGSSVGGPQAWQAILSGLPGNLPVPIVAVQHMSAGFIDGFVKWLQNYSNLIVRCAENGETILPGHIYFAPDNNHLEIIKKENAILAKLTNQPAKNGFKPSISSLLYSANIACQKNVIAGLLTGMGEDGADALLEIKNNNGETFIQDKESSLIFGMAGKAFSLGATKIVLPLNEISNYLMDQVGFRR